MPLTQTISSQIKELREIDPSLVTSTAIMSPDQIIATIGWLNSRKNGMNADVEAINKRIKMLEKLLDYKIDFTIGISGIQGNDYIAVPDTQLQLELKPETVAAPVKDNVVQLIPKVTAPDAEKFAMMVAQEASIPSIVLDAECPNSISKAVHILKGSYSKYKTITKGAQIALANLGLGNSWHNPNDWVNESKENISEDTRSKNIIGLSKLLEEANIDPNDFTIDNHDSIPTKIVNWEVLTVNAKGEYLNKEGKVIIPVAATAPIALPETTVEDAVVVEETAYTTKMLHEEIQAMKSEGKKSKHVKHVVLKKMEQLSDVDVPKSKQEKEALFTKLWSNPLPTEEVKNEQAVVEEVKSTTSETADSTQNTESTITADNKESVVTEAEEKAYATDPKEVEAEVKKLVHLSIVDKSMNLLNVVNQYFKTSGARKLFPERTIGTMFKKWKSEVIQEHEKETEHVTVEPTQRAIRGKLFKEIDIKSTYPEIAKEAEACKAPLDIINLVKDIVFNRKFEGKNDNYQVARNVAVQYMNNIPVWKDMTLEAKESFFAATIKGETIERKKQKEAAKLLEQKPEETVTTPPVETESKVEEAPAEVKQIMDQVPPITSKNKLRKLCSDFLQLSYKTLEDRKKEFAAILMTNSKYKKSKTEEIMNFINNVVTSDKNIAALA